MSNDTPSDAIIVKSSPAVGFTLLYHDVIKTLLGEHFAVIRTYLAMCLYADGKPTNHAEPQQVIDELGKAMSLEAVVKADHKVFHIPGDKPWEK